jgi:hypothetical protein
MASIFQTAKRLLSNDYLRKSGQYLQLEPWVTEIKNQDSVVPKDQREKLVDRMYGNYGKLRPEDFDKIVTNNNLDVMDALLARRDLSNEQLLRMTEHPEQFTSGHTYKRKDQAKNFYKHLFARIAQKGLTNFEKITKEGSAQALLRLFGSNPHYMTGQDLFHLVTQRKDLPEEVFAQVFKHSDFDASHGIELLKHENDNTIINGLARLATNDRLPPHIVAAAVRHEDPEVRRRIFNTDVIPVTNAQVRHALESDDPKVKQEAAGRVTTRDDAQYIMDNLTHLDNHSDIVENLINSSNLGFGRGINANPRIERNRSVFDQDLLDQIADYSVEKNQDLLDDYSHYWGNDIHPRSINKILAMPDDVTRNSVKKAALEHRNTTPDEIETALNNTTKGDTLYAIALRKQARSDQLDRVWEKMPKEGDEWYRKARFAAIAENANTSPATLSDMLNYRDVIGDEVMGNIAVHPNLPTDKLQFYLDQKDPAMRMLPSINPSATPEQIMQGITDKHRDVRESWWQHPGIEPDHLKLGLKDRSPKIRLELMKHPKMTPELLHHAITNDKDVNVRTQALGHANASAESVSHALLNDPVDSVRTQALVHPNLPPEMIDKAMEKPSVGLADKLKNKEGLTSDQIRKLYGTIPPEYQSALDQKKKSLADYEAQQRYRNMSRLMERYIQHPNMPEDLKVHAAQNYSLGDLRGWMLGKTHVATPKVLKTLFDRIQEKGGAGYGGYLDDIAKHPNFAKTDILDQMTRSADADMRLRAARNPDLSSDQIRTLIMSNSPGNNKILGELASKKNLDGELLDNFIRQYHDDGQLMAIASRNPNLTEDHFDVLGGHDSSDVRHKLMQHPNVPMHILKEAVNDDSHGVKKLAKEKLAQHEPDAYNDAIDGHEVNIHPATEKLKHLKGLVEEAGGAIHKKDLQNIGFGGIPGQILDGKGNVTPESIDYFLKTIPHTRYNVSYDKWDGAQMHDDTKEQTVLQLNMTNDHIKQLKGQGLYEMFAKMFETSKASGHPVDHHSLGWARIDDSQPGHWHVDEIQSDFGQNTMRQLSQAEEQGADPTEIQKYKEGLKKIIKVFSGPFKSVNHAILAATHVVARNKDISSTSMDMPLDQARMSGMGTDRAFPGHFQHTYIQLPKDMKYGKKLKDEVMPQHESQETEVQYRKLVKSLKFMRELMEKAK